MTEEKNDELVVIKEANIPAIFIKDGCDPIIEGLKKEAAKFKGDITTAKGRKEIASFARKFSTAKSYLDKLGKTLSDEYRAKIAPINTERNKIKVCCDESRDQVRKPLTDWEDAEKKRVADIEKRIALFDDMKNDEIYSFASSVEVANVLENLKNHIVDKSYEEFELAATKAKESAKLHLEAKFIVLQNTEKEKAEADRLEKERLEKEQKEREEKIAEEAAETARVEAEARAEAEAKEAEEKARLEGVEKDRLAKEAIDNAERETLEAKLETERVEREKREAAEQADRDREQAVEDEKKRQVIQAEADKIAEEKRQANKRHRNKIHKEAKGSMMENGISEEDATIFVTMVKDGLVKNITINY